MRESRTSGSVGAPGGRPPGATRAEAASPSRRARRWFNRTPVGVRGEHVEAHLDRMSLSPSEMRCIEAKLPHVGSRVLLFMLTVKEHDY